MEAKKVIENVQAINGGQTTFGTLRLTDFHMVFSAPVEQPESTADDSSTTAASPPKKREKWITYPILSQCTFRPMPPSHHILSSIRVRCRDFTFITFNFSDSEVAREAFEFIKLRTCKLRTVEDLFAFKHKPMKMEKELNSWNLYDIKTELRRQGIGEKLPDKGWRITDINKDYTFCDSYPALFAVPTRISDNVLKYAKGFRSRCRIPVLSYMHPVNNCTITRSSQPNLGLLWRSNVQDEKLVAASFSVAVHSTTMEDTTPSSSQPNVTSATETTELELSDVERYEDELISRSACALYDDQSGKRLIYGAQQSNLIADARPTINAMVNQVGGQGSEVMARYKFADKKHLNIENIHVMRAALNKVVDVLKDTDISPLPPNQYLLQQSKWLYHISTVLDGASIIARQVGILHSNVLIHCSDGWDRTSQLSALSQIMLDPYYRTLEGFIVLVEKDWLSFGHMFRLRSGHLNLDAWFTVQKDGMAGATVHPGENDGRIEAFQEAFLNMIYSTKRIFKPTKEEADAATMGETASGQIVADEATTAKMVSPIFHQFLDCTYQLLRQHPNRFEFNERFLRRLFYHLYSCQYGTFLYNSEKQRRDARVAEKASSVWDYFLCRKSEFTNPDYNPIIDDHVKGCERILLPRMDEIRWWHQLFGRTDDEMNFALNAAALAEAQRKAAAAEAQRKAAAEIERKAAAEAQRKAVEEAEGKAVEEAKEKAAAAAPAAPAAPLESSDQANEEGNASVSSIGDEWSHGSVGQGSVLASIETANERLTPPSRQSASQPATTPSSESINPFVAVREGLSNLSFGRSMLTNFGLLDDPATSLSAKGPPPRSEQELREMT